MAPFDGFRRGIDSLHLVGRQGVSLTAHWLEWQDWAYPVPAEPFAMKDGQLIVPDRPGQGIEWDKKAVARLAL